MFWKERSRRRTCRFEAKTRNVGMRRVVFSARAHNSIVRPFDCPSQGHKGGSVKTVEVRIMKFSPYGSLIPLVYAG